jgi:hypothetical protein
MPQLRPEWSNLYFHQHGAPPKLSRRKLLRSTASLLALVLAGGGTPLLEGAVVNTRLRKVLKGAPTEEKTAEVARIMIEIKEHNLRASPELMVEAANQFATYQSSLQAMPLNVKYLTTLTATSDHGSPYKPNVGCAEENAVGKARLNGIGKAGDNNFTFGFNLGNCSDVVVWPEETAILLLDNLDGENATFLNCTLNYNGGKLALKNVRFVACTFQISGRYARNQNVFRFLTLALTEQPINLELN